MRERPDDFEVDPLAPEATPDLRPAGFDILAPTTPALESFPFETFPFLAFCKPALVSAFLDFCGFSISTPLLFVDMATDGFSLYTHTTITFCPFRHQGKRSSASPDIKVSDPKEQEIQ